jgi:hypothetical protein
MAPARLAQDAGRTPPRVRGTCAAAFRASAASGKPVANRWAWMAIEAARCWSLLPHYLKDAARLGPVAAPGRGSPVQGTRSRRAVPLRGPFRSKLVLVRTVQPAPPESRARPCGTSRGCRCALWPQPLDQPQRSWLPALPAVSKPDQEAGRPCPGCRAGAPPLAGASRTAGCDRAARASRNVAGRRPVALHQSATCPPVGRARSTNPANPCRPAPAPERAALLSSFSIAVGPAGPAPLHPRARRGPPVRPPPTPPHAHAGRASSVSRSGRPGGEGFSGHVP